MVAVLTIMERPCPRESQPWYGAVDDDAQGGQNSRQSHAPRLCRLPCLGLISCIRCVRLSYHLSALAAPLTRASAMLKQANLRPSLGCWSARQRRPRYSTFAPSDCWWRLLDKDIVEMDHSPAPGPQVRLTVARDSM